MARAPDLNNPAIRSVATVGKLEELFGQKARLEYPRFSYKANVVTVEAELEHAQVWLQFMPSQGWAELRIVGRPFSIVKLCLSDVSHLNVRRRDKNLVLVIRFARAFTSDLILWFRPQVMLFWGNQGPGSVEPLESASR